MRSFALICTGGKRKKRVICITEENEKCTRAIRLPTRWKGEIQMATVKKTVKEAAEVKATPVKKEEAKVETKAAEVKAEVKAEAKVEKAPAKKAAAKTTAAKAPAKKAAAKKTTSSKEVKVSLNVQFGGKSYTTDDLVKIAKDVWKYDLKQKAADFKSVELYVKPEDGMAYYVINGKEAGSFYI